MKYTPTILVVDDEDDLRKGIKELIESRLGWTVVDARNGYEASEKIEETRSFMSLGTPKIDCVILTHFLLMYSGHCKKLAPEYEAAAEVLSKNDPPIALAKVDATVEKTLAERFGIQGFPTLYWFK